jgi:hypothetical protein
MRVAGVVSHIPRPLQDDGFVTDVHGILSYGDAVKERTFGIGSSSSSSSSSVGSGSGGKASDLSLDRQLVFQHCSLSALQVHMRMPLLIL